MVELFDQWIVKAKIEEVSNIGVFLQIIPVSQILEWMVDGQCGKSQVHRDCRCKDRTRILEMIVIRGIFFPTNGLSSFAHHFRLSVFQLPS
jgi:DNA-directed RNA polymerase subunit E'/Rpb7